VLFVQGCALRCLFCHNPDTWETGGGKILSVSQIIGDISAYLPFISGFTVSGGEPLLQPDFCAALLAAVKTLGLHTAIDTAGSVPLSLGASKVLAAVDAADMLLLDITTADPALSVKLVGRDITGIATEYLNYCESAGKDVWIRHVIIPGLTALPEQLRGVAEKIADYSCVKRVQLLPFHKMGEFKWRELNRDYTLSDTLPPSDEEMNLAAAIFREHGLEVS
jgi:pyruvate formate lyase activating enzyme